MGGNCSGTMRGNTVEHFFRRDYDEPENDCKLTRHTVWTPSLAGGSGGRRVEDAGDDVAHKEFTLSGGLGASELNPGIRV